MRSYAQTFFPARYWLFVVFGVGVPGFTPYTSGQIVEHGIVTPQSIAEIILSCSCGMFFFAMTLSGGKAVAAPAGAPSGR